MSIQNNAVPTGKAFIHALKEAGEVSKITGEKHLHVLASTFAGFLTGAWEKIGGASAHHADGVRIEGVRVYESPTFIAATVDGAVSGFGAGSFMRVSVDLDKGWKSITATLPATQEVEQALAHTRGPGATRVWHDEPLAAEVRKSGKRVVNENVRALEFNPPGEKRKAIMFTTENAAPGFQHFLDVLSKKLDGVGIGATSASGHRWAISGVSLHNGAMTLSFTEEQVRRAGRASD